MRVDLQGFSVIYTKPSQFDQKKCYCNIKLIWFFFSAFEILEKNNLVLKMCILNILFNVFNLQDK